MRWVIVALSILALEAYGRSGLVSRTTFVPPSTMLGTLWELARGGAMWPHLARTLLETIVAFVIGCAVGLPLGLLLWRVPYLGRISEPYLTALYALPLAFFYPLLLALLGLGPAPIIAIAALMAAVPIIVNTRIALGEVRAIYRRLGRSLGCSPLQLYAKIVLPAASPLLFAGIKMGFVYALIGSVAMEFVLADRGLGFAVRYHYNYFDAPEMYAYVLLILAIAIMVNWGLLRGEGAAERGLRG
ncbi:MAG: NitT/TauT family transport system permease protein [Chloroflexota bacterium]|jgi:NitT/TauT family transport system permease protein|nr:NitT/TauT family transport system permease protein [Chloroflexota bacterium]